MWGAAALPVLNVIFLLRNSVKQSFLNVHKHLRRFSKTQIPGYHLSFDLEAIGLGWGPGSAFLASSAYTVTAAPQATL